MYKYVLVLFKIINFKLHHYIEISSNIMTYLLSFKSHNILFTYKIQNLKTVTFSFIIKKLKIQKYQGLQINTFVTPLFYYGFQVQPLATRN